MKLSFHPETDFDCFLIAPLVSIVKVKCGNCEETHGISLTLGWFFWNFSIMLETEEG